MLSNKIWNALFILSIVNITVGGGMNSVLFILTMYWLYYVLNYIVWFISFYYKLKRKDLKCSRGLDSIPIHFKDLILWVPQKLNYYIHYMLGIIYIIKLKLFGYYEPNDTDVVNFVISTSLILWIKINPEINENDSVNITFYVNNLKFSWFTKANNWPKQNFVTFTAKADISWSQLRKLKMQQYGQKVLIKYTVHWNILSFECGSKLGTESIQKNDRRLYIISSIGSTYSHAQIHSYWNYIYRFRNELNNIGLHELCLHGFVINEYAKLAAYGLGMTIENVRSILQYNGIQDIKHNIDALYILSTISPWCKFMIISRKILFNLVNKYKIPCVPEHLFLTTIMHSVDHWGVYKFSKDIKMNRSMSPWISYDNGSYYFNKLDPIFNLGALYGFMLYQSNQYIFTNLLKRCKYNHPFYKELYDLLYNINPVFADQVTLSISY